MTRIGIMSFAHLHAEGYAACLREIPEAELACVWDDTPLRGREAAQRHGAPFEPDLDTFLATDMAGVIITSENSKHRWMVERAATAGQWILCEKPLATTVEDAKAMIAACEHAGVGLATAFPCRYATPLLAAKATMDSGEYGKVLAASCTNHGQFPGGWFGDPTLAGGGATMDHTVHVVDLLRWLTGLECTRVYCENGHLLGRDTSLDDMGVVHIEMEGGVIASQLASWSRPKSFPTWGDVTMELICENGVLTVDAFNQKLDVYDDAKMQHLWAGWGDNFDLGLVRDFVHAADTRTQPPITGVDGLRATEVTVAAYEAVRTGHPVAIKAA